MAELVIKIPEELEREVETWGVDLQPLFLTFLKREFNKIKRFESAVKESKSDADVSYSGHQCPVLFLPFRIKSYGIF